MNTKTPSLLLLLLLFAAPGYAQSLYRTEEGLYTGVASPRLVNQGGRLVPLVEGLFGYRFDPGLGIRINF